MIELLINDFAAGVARFRRTILIHRFQWMRRKAMIAIARGTLTRCLATAEMIEQKIRLFFDKRNNTKKEKNEIKNMVVMISNNVSFFLLYLYIDFLHTSILNDL